MQDSELFAAKDYFGIMQNPFQPGDKLVITHWVSENDIAQFEGNAVHHVYSTFAIARDAEWAGRQFVLQMKDETEEGIGTYVHVDHHTPAFVGEEVVFESTLHEVQGNAVICSFTANVGERIIATGRTGQKILSKEKLYRHFESLKGGE